MSLKRTLRKAGYDLIDGPVRNHKLLQMWLKDPGNPPTLYYRDIDHALTSPIELTVVEDPALNVDYKQKETFKFNIGITVLDQLLSSIGLANLGLSVAFGGGKSVSISFRNSKTLTVALGELEAYLGASDFSHPNRPLLDNANRNRILLISGILIAQDFKAVIETNTEFEAELEAKFNEIAEGKATFKRTSETKLAMSSEGNAFIPVAVQAHRLDWDNGEYSDMNLITDNRNIF